MFKMSYLTKKSKPKPCESINQTNFEKTEKKINAIVIWISENFDCCHTSKIINRIWKLRAQHGPCNMLEIH